MSLPQHISLFPQWHPEATGLRRNSGAFFDPYPYLYQFVPGPQKDCPQRIQHPPEIHQKPMPEGIHWPGFSIPDHCRKYTQDLIVPDSRLQIPAVVTAEYIIILTDTNYTMQYVFSGFSSVESHVTSLQPCFSLCLHPDHILSGTQEGPHTSAHSSIEQEPLLGKFLLISRLIHPEHRSCEEIPGPLPDPVQ